MMLSKQTPEAAWLENSPLSPLQLETLAALRGAQINWRDAYEDLLRCEAGLPLVEPTTLGRSGGMDRQKWAREALQRLEEVKRERWQGGIPIEGTSVVAELEKQMQQESLRQEGEQKALQVAAQPQRSGSREESREYSNDAPGFVDKDNEEGQFFPASELAMFEQLFGLQHHDNDNNNKQRPITYASSCPDESEKNPSSTILSTLTHTERTVDAATGRTITRTVLNKRFADGREENTETVETSPSPSSPQSDSPAPISNLWQKQSGVFAPAEKDGLGKGSVLDALKEKKEAQGMQKLEAQRGQQQQQPQQTQRKGGWFWSS